MSEGLAASAALVALVALGLAGCSSQGTGAPTPQGSGDYIACAVGGSAELADACAVERVEQDGQLSLVVHHPDGGFRRFDVRRDGTGLAVADGADEAETRLDEGKLSVTVGPDRYVFPVTMRKKGAAAAQ
ncbi:hypothetical protein I5E68_07670 [Novosphingobium sp. YJ-S2-02]|uniref:Lipoprotein n=1 Tax=Novosphingobium aureum TaxID=2792964 RepID=A0A931HC93_9SPHN|nr:hypothetical protein [Novosphingobium aureum]MBH0112828.1 hypothetical protein [Novosphingobium aureum]